MSEEIILHSSGGIRGNTSVIYTEDQLEEAYGLRQPDEGWKGSVETKVKRDLTCSRLSVKNMLKCVFPPSEWLPKYKVRENLVGDTMAGLTVGIVHLPQGMAYGLLASLPAVTGLYVSFFPVLVYVFFGTSRHISIGTFAVVSLMIAQVVNQDVLPCSESKISLDSATSASLSPTGTAAIDNDAVFTTTSNCELALDRRKMEIAVALAMANGIIQVAMSILRLGIVTTYLSTHLVSGFTCGAAFHVMTSQVPKLLGITVERVSGPFALIYAYVDLFKHISSTNWATVIISFLCILFLAVGKIFNRKCHERFPIPLPWELAVVLIATTASYFGKFNTKYGVQTVGYIPTGIEVSVPKSADIGDMMLSAFPIAIVSFATEISLSEMFATKHSYKIDSNQELLAMGLGNIVGSFFSCFPASASLSRSVICEEVGARTQLNGFFSSALILVILLWIGPFFEPLPQAALAAIIIVNLKGLLKQFERVPRLWRLSKFDALIWIVTWASVVLLGVSFGLGASIIFQIFTVVLRTQRVKGSAMVLVGAGGESSDYRDVRKYHTEISNRNSGVILFQFPGPIIFANKERFRSDAFKVLGFDPTLKSTHRNETAPNQDSRVRYFAAGNVGFQEHEHSNQSASHSMDSDSDTPLSPTSPLDLNLRVSRQNSSNTGAGRTTMDRLRNAGMQPIARKNITHFILDMSCTPFIDNDGAKAIRALHSAFLQADIAFFLASCNVDVRKILTVECDKQRPPFFTSVFKAMDVAEGRVAIEFNDTGHVLSIDHRMECDTGL